MGQVYVYSTSPVSKIIGSFEVGDIIEDSPEAIWRKCHRHAAISEDEFFRYFNGTKTAFAIKIARPLRFVSPLDPYSLIENFRPPQSFCYLSFDLRQDNCSTEDGLTPPTQDAILMNFGRDSSGSSSSISK